MAVTEATEPKNPTGCFDCGKKAPLTSRTAPGQKFGAARCDECDAKFIEHVKGGKAE